MFLLVPAHWVVSDKGPLHIYVLKMAFWILHGTVVTFAFSALTLLVGRQEGHPACKKSGGVLAWLSLWSKMQTCIWPN